MARATAAATVLLINLLFPSSCRGQDVVVAMATTRNNERRSLRRGLTNDGERPGVDVDYRTRISTSKEKKAVSPTNFFDLSDVTEMERDEMIKMAYFLKESEGSIDWGIHRDNYEHALKQSMSRLSQSSDISLKDTRALQGAGDTFDGDVFNKYEYSRGNCPNSGSKGVPCAPENLPLLCNKYNRDEGSFRECLDACKPAFCCVHNAPLENWMAPNCNTDENCSQYNWCYIAWWKLRDTIGPALYLRVEQNQDDWFDIDNKEIDGDVTNDPFFQPFFLSPFGDIDKVIEDGTEEIVGEDGSVTSNFNADRIFNDPEYWDYKPEY